MKHLIFLIAFLPSALFAQVQNSNLAQGLLLAVQSGANALPGSNLVTNGTFDTATTGWTLTGGSTTVENGELKVYGAAYASAKQSVTVVSGATYSITYKIRATTATVAISMGSSDDGAQYVDVGYAGNTARVDQVVVKATGTTIYIKCYVGAGGEAGYYDNIVIRPIHQSALCLPNPAYTLSNSGATTTYGHKGNSSYFAYDGVDDITTHAYTTASSSFAIWIYPTVTNKLWVNMGTNMTIGIDGSNNLSLGSALTNPVKYVNGVVSNAVTLNAWNYIVIKSDAITPTTLQFGYVSSSYGAFNLKGFIAFNYGVDADTAAYYSSCSNHIKKSDVDGSGNEATLILSPEGMLPGIWRDAYHSTDIAVGTGSTSPRLVKDWAGMNAWRFNGTSSYLTKSSAADGLTGDITISGWIFIKDWGSSSSTSLIFNNSKLQILLYNPSTPRIIVRRDGSNEYTSATNPFALHTWNHLLITSTSAGVTNLYINGILSGTANQSAGTPSSGTTYYIGTYSNDYYLNGIIEDFRIYNRILSSEQIQNSYLIFED